VWHEIVQEILLFLIIAWIAWHWLVEHKDLNHDVETYKKTNELINKLKEKTK